MLYYLKLCLFLLLVSLSSKADCLPDIEGLCIPGVTITEDTQVDIVEEDKGTEIVTTTTTTVTTTTTAITNEDSGDILDGNNSYVTTTKQGDMDYDWGGEGPANITSGNSCYGLGSDKCAQITGGGNSTSTMGVPGMGTTFINTIDISDLEIDNGGKVKYTIEVDKQDAQDRIYMHITGLNGTSQVFSGTDILSESGVSTGYQSYKGSFDFGGVLKTLKIEIGGRDINLAVGPVFDDVSVNVFYNVINTIVEQQITSVEEIVYLNIFDPVEIEFATEVIEFNDITVDEAGDIEFAPIESQPEEVSYETVELEIQEFELNIPEPEVASVEIEAEMELEIEMEVAQIEEVVDEQPTEEEATEPDSETTEEPVVEVKDSTEQEDVQQEEAEEPKEPVKEPSAKEKAATKVVKKIDDKARYDESNQIKTLIVMQILGNTKTFFDTQSTIQDANVNEYLNKVIDDPYGDLFIAEQGQIMEEIINAQY
jgi:hypothetical protein